MTDILASCRYPTNPQQDVWACALAFEHQYGDAAFLHAAMEIDRLMPRVRYGRQRAHWKRRAPLKVMVGYDALVLVRPNKIVGEVTGVRDGRLLVFRNVSNTAQEIYDGRQCVGNMRDCRGLPAKPLYAGASWAIELPVDAPVEFSVTDGVTFRRLSVR